MREFDVSSCQSVRSVLESKLYHMSQNVCETGQNLFSWTERRLEAGDKSKMRLFVALYNRFRSLSSPPLGSTTYEASAIKYVL